jgi:hypothetical protein
MNSYRNALACAQREVQREVADQTPPALLAYSVRYKSCSLRELTSSVCDIAAILTAGKQEKRKLSLKTMRRRA